MVAVIDKLVDAAIDAEVDDFLDHLADDDYAAAAVAEPTPRPSAHITSADLKYDAFTCWRHQAGRTGYFGDRWCSQCNHALRSRCWLRLRDHLDNVTKNGGRTWHVVFTIPSSDDPLRPQLRRLLDRYCKRLTKSAKDGEIVGGCWFAQTTFNASTDQFHPHVHAVIESDTLPDWIGRFWNREVLNMAGRNRVSWYIAEPLAAPFTDDPSRMREVITESYRLRMRDVFGSWRGIGLFSSRRRKGEPDVEGQSPEGRDEVMEDRERGAKSGERSEPGAACAPLVRPQRLLDLDDDLGTGAPEDFEHYDPDPQPLSYAAVGGTGDVPTEPQRPAVVIQTHANDSGTSSDALGAGDASRFDWCGFPDGGRSSVSKRPKRMGETSILHGGQMGLGPHREMGSDGLGHPSVMGFDGQGPSQDGPDGLWGSIEMGGDGDRHLTGLTGRLNSPPSSNGR